MPLQLQTGIQIPAQQQQLPVGRGFIQQLAELLLPVRRRQGVVLKDQQRALVADAAQQAAHMAQRTAELSPRPAQG